MRNYTKTLSTTALEALHLIRMEGPVKMEGLPEVWQDAVRDELVPEGLVQVVGARVSPRVPELVVVGSSGWLTAETLLSAASVIAGAVAIGFFALLAIRTDPLLWKGLVAGGVSLLTGYGAGRVRRVDPVD